VNLIAAPAMPSGTMRLLLQAALLPGPAAQSAWDQWLASVDFERLEPGATELLSLVSRNVTGLDGERPIDRRVRGVHRMTWANNRIVWARAASLVDEVAATIGPPVLVGSVARLPAYADDWGARPFDRVELALPVSAAGATRDVLSSTRWVVDGVTPSLIARTQAGLVARWEARHPDGSWVTVRWHVLRDIQAAVVDEQFIGASRPTMVGSSAVRLLHPADALIERLWHGPREQHPTWIADVVQLGRCLARLATTGDEGRAFARFGARAHRLGIARPLSEHLELALAVVPDPRVHPAIDALRGRRPSSASVVWALAGPTHRVGRSLAGHCAGQGLGAGLASLLRAQLSKRRLRFSEPAIAPRG
jgi:hypothetical protein